MFISERISLITLKDLIKDKENSVGNRILMVQRETMMAEVQVLVMKMDRRQIQKCVGEKVDRVC